MDRTPQDRVLAAQLFLYNLADELDVLGQHLPVVGQHLTDNPSARAEELANQAHDLGVELEQVMAAFPGVTPATLMQTVSLCLGLVEAEESRANQRCNDLRARLAEDVRGNTPEYHEAMAYHKHTGSAIQVLRKLQRDLRPRVSPGLGVCSSCGCTEEDCSGCIAATGEPCGWADAARTLCTRCAKSSLESATILAAGEDRS